jgi:voltage-gated potassium channel
MPTDGPIRIVMSRKPALKPMQTLLIRAALVVGLIVFVVLIHWLDRDGYRDNLDGTLTFIDVLYFTMVTVTTTGFGDIVPITQEARLFDALVVTPIRIFIWLVFIGTAYEFLFKQVMEQRQMRTLQQALTGHTIVCGYGSSGSAVVGELLRKGIDPARIVVVDPSERALDVARELGVITLLGDATRNATLEAAKIDRAAALLISAGRDDTNVLILLTARRLARPELVISTGVRQEENEDIMRQAGANVVVNPVRMGGHLLATSIDGPHLVDYVEDLITEGGRVTLRERAVALHEVGRSLHDICNGVGLRIQRGPKAYGFWEPEARALVAGDMIVEIVPERPEDARATPALS